MDISLAKLTHLVTVAETGNISKAAEKLNLSQPALSRSIAALERRYGGQIFTRVGHGVELTAFGHLAVAQARSLLRRMRVFDKNLQLYAGSEVGELSFGIAPQLASYLLPDLATHLFGLSSQIRLRTLIRGGPALLEALQSDAIDMMFSTADLMQPSPDVEIQIVGWVTPAFLTRASHPLAGRSDLTLKDLQNYPFAAIADLPFGSEWPTPAFICDNFYVLRDVVMENDLIWASASAFVPRELASGKLTRIFLSDYPTVKAPVVAAWLSGRIPSPLAQRTRDFVASVLDDELKS